MADALYLRFVSGPDVESLALTRAEILAAVEQALRAQGLGEAVLEPRVHLRPPNAGAGHFNVLRGHLGLSGVKVVGDFVDNHRRGLPSELALITLHDPQTGAPVAVIDGTLITEARTGAVTAVGARHLARPDARVLGHLGARGTAWWNVCMLDDLLDLDEIRVTSRRPESREAFAEALSAELATPVRAVATAEEALDGADVLVEATRLVEPAPLLRTEWVAPGCLVVPYGTISAVERSLIGAIDKVVVDDWGQATAGPFGALREHVDAGLLTEQTVHAELGQIVAGLRPGRESPRERILLWHRGLSITDIAVARLVLDRATEQDLGTVLRYR